MSDPRMTGLALMAISTSAFVGTTSESLPAVTFFPALLLFLVGAYKFLRSMHEGSTSGSEERGPHGDPRDRRPQRQPGAGLPTPRVHGGQATEDAATSSNNANEFASSEAVAPRDSIDFDAQPTDLVVETDVSYPVEVQTGEALADQLRKLNQLLEQGILTAEEYAVAKAKLLG